MEEALEKRLGELLLQLKSGDVSVLSEIDMIIGKRLRSYANIYYLQKADVDDAVQSLLYKLYFAVKRYSERKHAYSWVVKVFKNSILSRIKKEKHEKEYFQMLGNEMLIKQNGNSDIYATNYLFVNEIMSKLDKCEQELVKYVFVLGMSYSETAKALHKAKSTIEYQVLKLKEKISKMD